MPTKKLPPAKAFALSASGNASANVSLQRATLRLTPDLPLWVVIRNSTRAIAFDEYKVFLDKILCGPKPPTDTDFLDLSTRRSLPFTDTDAYRTLKIATELFLMMNCGVALKAYTQDDALESTRRLDETVTPKMLNDLWKEYLSDVSIPDTIPYLDIVRQKLGEIPIATDNEMGLGLARDCMRLVRCKLLHPCLLELIWSYWHEEGMLVQTMNAISLRFQNVRMPERNPLAGLEIDPLRPLNNFLWGYIQDEQHRLTVQRRVYEYDHHYGLRLYGRAVREFRAADSRSKFLETFHNLLHLCTIFYKEDDDTTVKADGFPILNALKDVHFLLAEGAHNQFGDLPSTARIEMLMQQWILARPEFREFLPTRIMVAYPEPWMDRVDAMKNLQAWTDTSILHFHNLANFGEQILLSIRYGAWGEINERDNAAVWARYWRDEIQGYIHAYRAATGVDLTSDITDVRTAQLRFAQPSLLLRQRTEMRREMLAYEPPLTLPSPAMVARRRT